MLIRSKFKLLAILLLHGSAGVFGQNNIDSVSSQKTKHFSVGINLSPNYCYRKLNENNSVRDKYEEPKVGYSIGFGICYDVSSVLSLETGVQFTDNGYRLSSWDGLTYNDMIDPLTGKLYNTTEIAPPNLIYDIYYFDFPLRCVLHFGKKKIHFISSAGLTLNIWSKTSVNYNNVNNNYSSPPYHFNNINFSPTVSIGLNYRINDKFNLCAEPTFRYGILKITEAPIPTYLWNAGLNIGFYYKP